MLLSRRPPRSSLAAANREVRERRRREGAGGEDAARGRRRRRVRAGASGARAGRLQSADLKCCWRCDDRGADTPTRSWDAITAELHPSLHALPGPQLLRASSSLPPDEVVAGSPALCGSGGAAAARVDCCRSGGRLDSGQRGGSADDVSSHRGAGCTRVGHAAEVAIRCCGCTDADDTDDS